MVVMTGMRGCMRAPCLPHAGAPPSRTGAHPLAGAEERVGFEPTVRCRTHDFQSCPFGLSGISPGSMSMKWEERVGVEPTLPFGKPDFESGAFGHSAISPTISLS